MHPMERPCVHALMGSDDWAVHNIPETSFSLTHTKHAHAYTVLVGYIVKQKVYKHGFPPAIRLERMETERTGIYRGE